MSAAAEVQEKTSLHVVSRAELAEGDHLDRWHDPDGIVPLSPPKRATLLANPLGRGDEEPVQIIGTRGRRVIGRLDLLSGRLVVDREPVDCLWGSALYVPESQRDSLMGVQLVLKMQALHHTVASCGISRLAYPLFARLKWLDVAMPRYVLVRHSRAVLERRLSDSVGRAAVPVVDAALLGQRGLLSAWLAVTARGLRCEEAEALPTEASAALRELGADVATYRSPEWVSWLRAYAFDAEPRSRRALFLVRDRRDRPVAYFLVKARVYEEASGEGYRDLYLGSLGDWAVIQPGAVDLRRIVLFAVAELSKWGVDAVEMCVPPDEDLSSVRRLGFRRAGDLHLMVRASSRSPLSDRARSSPGSWRVRPADGDNFFS
jgi:hypothetical protein